MSNTLIAQLNNPLVLQRINQRMASIISMLLIVACAWVLVEITWMFFPQAEDVSMPVQHRAKSFVNQQEQQISFNKLRSANIFGESEKAVVQSQEKAPETKLNLTLKGVLATLPMELASAIIAQGKSGKEDIYSIGDKMPGGVSIKEIHPDFVVLERNGSAEILKLQKESGLDGFESSDNGNAMNTGLSSLNRSPAVALKNIRSEIMKNPTSFGDYALPVVVKENGKQVGYRLQPQKKGQMLSQLGIQPGDVITQINGVKLDNQQNGISALRKLSTATNLNIVVKRNGAEIPLNISLQ
jgi:general secretion pathway protein C